MAIADAIKEVFGFLREFNNADQKQKRYALKRIKNIKKATDLAETIFCIVDEILDLIEKDGVLPDSRKDAFKKLQQKYKKLVQKFNKLD